MSCPRCGSHNIRRSQSQDSVWFRFVLQQKMRCHRCCFVFVAPMWERIAAVPQPPEHATADELETVTAAGI